MLSLSIWAWLISLDMSSSAVHLAVNHKISLFVLIELYSILCLYQIVIIHQTCSSQLAVDSVSWLLHSITMGECWYLFLILLKVMTSEYVSNSGIAGPI